MHAFQLARALDFQCRFVSSEVEQGWLRAHHCWFTRLYLLNLTRTCVRALRVRALLVTGRTNLVDPASSHMLVSKIKPCMSQYKLPYGEIVNGSLKQF